MKTGSIEINGKKYLLCFSARTMKNIVDKYGNVSFDELLSVDEKDLGKTFDTTMWLLSLFLDAGSRFAKLNGLENPDPLSYEDLYDLCGFDDLSKLKGSISKTISSGLKRNVETEPRKNLKTTPAS